MGQDRYPIPEHAATIWTDGKKIYLNFPGYRGTEDRNFHTVILEPHLPCKCKRCGASQCEAETKVSESVALNKTETCGGEFDSPTITILWDILSKRANARVAEDRKIGSKAAPVQYDLEKIQRFMKGSGKTAKQDIGHLSVEEMMKELDL
jgi:hypothetical protein